MEREEGLMGDMSDDPDAVLGDALDTTDIVHPVWGTGSVLAMWNRARQTCYVVPGAWRALQNDPAKLENLLQHSYDLAPKLEMLVSMLAYFTAHGTADASTQQGKLGKHLIFANHKGPGLHAISHFLTGLGFERISSAAQLGASVQNNPDAHRFIAMEGVTKDNKVLLRAFNSPDNSMGNMIAVGLLATALFKEGVDFKDVACVHIMDPPGTYGELRQIVGRPSRLCSHARLESLYGDKICVDVFIYCSVIGHPEFYNGQMSMIEFPLKFCEHLNAAGVKNNLGADNTIHMPYDCWPLLNSSPDEVTLKHVIETKQTADGMEHIIQSFSADRVVSHNRRHQIMDAPQYEPPRA